MIQVAVMGYGTVGSGVVTGGTVGTGVVTGGTLGVTVGRGKCKVFLAKVKKRSPLREDRFLYERMRVDGFRATIFVLG